MLHMWCSGLICSLLLNIELFHWPIGLPLCQSANCYVQFAEEIPRHVEADFVTFQFFPQVRVFFKDKASTSAAERLRKIVAEVQIDGKPVEEIRGSFEKNDLGNVVSGDRKQDI